MAGHRRAAKKDPYPDRCAGNAGPSAARLEELPGLTNIDTIVTHDECPDGTASAILLHDAIPAARVLFLEYGSEAHRLLPARPGMIFCDFSPPRVRRSEFLSAGAIVLDHHRTAKDIVVEFGDRGVFGDESKEPGVAGAVLAFRHVWLPLRRDSPYRAFAERFATMAGVRDTWQTTDPLWQEGCDQAALLMSFPHQFWLATQFRVLATDWADRFAWVGRQLINGQRRRVERAIRTAHRFVGADGVRVCAFDGLTLTSDAAEALGSRVDVVIGFGFTEDEGHPWMRLSLRSETNFDCGQFAAHFGGGGHTRAAGFSVRLGPDDRHPFAAIERLFSK